MASVRPKNINYVKLSVLSKHFNFSWQTFNNHTQDYFNRARACPQYNKVKENIFKGKIYSNVYNWLN